VLKEYSNKGIMPMIISLCDSDGEVPTALESFQAEGSIEVDIWK
jgi:hypothetical protein